MSRELTRGSVLRWPCPVQGCSYKGYTQKGLEQHLTSEHKKDELLRMIMARISPKLERSEP